MKEALHYRKTSGQGVRCELCPHECSIKPGGSGICRQRRNDDGTLTSLNYGRATSVALDPIEKKPLYHFHPGSRILSLGTNGCNFQCPWCQNSGISQEDAPTDEISPEHAVAAAVREKSVGIAYTYNEPFIWYEFVLETAKLARQRKLANVLVTNGCVNPKPLAELLPFIDALNVDIKSIDEDFYGKHCKARLAPVLETCKTASRTAHVEITNLVIPGENDSERNFSELAGWVAENCGEETPLHFSAYFPRYLFKAEETPVETLAKAYEVARKSLRHVYIGNVTMPEGRDSVCKSCGAVLVERHGYRIADRNLAPGGKCAKCGTANNFRM
jgi:pyruvate formate lyase activating enzyme